MSCFACGERGAAINCQEKGCSRSFHLPCASENGCVTQFFKAFCSEHRPEQAVPVRPDAHTTCIICMEPVDENLSSGTMVCPSCKGAWFHRGRIQGQATSAGRECFRCPQPPAWEEDGRYEELYERHSQCDAGQCLHREGRQQAEESGPWELLLCSSCAPKGTHRRCSAVAADMDAWECDGCAGTGPGIHWAYCGLDTCLLGGLADTMYIIGEAPEVADPGLVMLVSKKVKRFLQLMPGKQRFGAYRFLPFFFLLGGAMEWFMINVRIGKETFCK
ncbi:PHD finger protein 7-like [Apteryx mantelli]|uniref:PHD finger protein 7-like n=1 Tax=Apteryx mantelli TaxID=2696672 RepID=A0ABM4F457_9AVES